jgi:hypothetical protein
MGERQCFRENAAESNERIVPPPPPPLVAQEDAAQDDFDALADMLDTPTGARFETVRNCLKPATVKSE